MHIRKAGLPKDILKKINLYRDKDLAEIKKIRVRWARGATRQYPRRSSDRLLYVNLENLIKLADFGEMMYVPLNPRQLFTGVDERDFRVAMILDRWNKEGAIDPPELGLNHLGQISFGNGRHRTITAFHLGEEEIPVEIDLSHIEIIGKLIDLRNHKKKS